MKKIIGSLLLVVGFAFNAYAQDDEPRSANLLKAEAQFSSLFLNHLIKAGVTSPDDDTWIDGGRAFFEREEIVQDIENFLSLLDGIKGPKKGKKTALKIQAIHRRDLEPVQREIFVAIQALPNMYHSLKESLELKLTALYSTNTLSSKDFEVLINELNQLKKVYTEEVPKFEFKSPVQEASKLEVQMLLSMCEALIETTKMIPLTDVELGDLLDDFEDHSGLSDEDGKKWDNKGFKEFDTALRQKFGYYYYHFDMLQMVDSALETALSDMARYLGYYYDIYSGRVGDSGFRREQKQEVAGKSQSMQVQARMELLKAAVAKLKL